MLKKIMTAMISVIVFTVFAVVITACGNKNTSSDGGLTYTLSDDGTYYILSVDREKNENVKEITVPDYHEGLPVQVGYKAFEGLKSLEKLYITSAYAMGKNAVTRCPKLKEVTVCGDVDVSEKCFTYLLALEKVTFGEGVKSIGKNCFVECEALKEVVIGDDCKVIGESAFENCKSLSEVSFGKGLTDIGGRAFAGCTALKNVSFPTENVLTIGKYAFEYAGLTELHIPANLRLGEYSFGHLAWDESIGASRCKAAYFYSTEPTKVYLGTNSIGYTWDRMAADDAELGDFIVYVPEDALETYAKLMEKECDESWMRCVVNAEKLKAFDPSAEQ